MDVLKAYRWSLSRGWGRVADIGRAWLLRQPMEVVA
jgi:hypothetical protein